MEPGLGLPIRVWQPLTILLGSYHGALPKLCITARHFQLIKRAEELCSRISGVNDIGALAEITGNTLRRCQPTSLHHSPALDPVGASQST